MMKVFSKEYGMYLKRVSSRLFSSAGEMATNKGHSFNLKYVTDELKVIGAIGAAIFVLSKIEIDSLKTAVNQIKVDMKSDIKESEAKTSNIINQIKVDMKSDIRDSEARTSNHIRDSEARTSNVINQIKVDMKSDIKESEDRMRNEMTLSEQRIKSDIKASEIRIFQKIDDALEGKK